MQSDEEVHEDDCSEEDSSAEEASSLKEDDNHVKVSAVGVGDWCLTPLQCIFLQLVQKFSMKHVRFCPTLCLLPRLAAFWYVFYNESGNNLWFQATCNFYSILTTCSINFHKAYKLLPNFMPFTKADSFLVCESDNNLLFQITYSFYSILTTCSKILALFTIPWYSIITRRMLPPHSKIVVEHSMIKPFC
jgi:hypothetical protein